MNTSSDNGGIRQLLYWLLGLSSSVIIGTLTVWLSSIHGELVTLRASVASENSRIAVLESVLASHGERIRDIEKKLEGYATRDRTRHLPGE